MFKLTIQNSTYTLNDGITVIGRGEDADISIDSSGLSRMHARFTVEGNQIRIEDLGSKNGTWVNGERISEALTLKDGDKLKLAAAEGHIAGAAAAAEPAIPRKPNARPGRSGKNPIRQAAIAVIVILVVLTAIRIWTQYEPADLKDAKSAIEASVNFVQASRVKDTMEENFSLLDSLAEHRRILEEIPRGFADQKAAALQLVNQLDKLKTEIEERNHELETVADAAAALEKILAAEKAGTLEPLKVLQQLAQLALQFEDTETAARATEQAIRCRNKIQKKELAEVNGIRNAAETLGRSGAFGRAAAMLDTCRQAEFHFIEEETMAGLEELSNELRGKGLEQFRQAETAALEKALTGDCKELSTGLHRLFEQIGLAELEGDLETALLRIDGIRADRLARARAALRRKLDEIHPFEKTRQYAAAAERYAGLLDRIAEEELKAEVASAAELNRLLGNALSDIIAYIGKNKGMSLEGLGEMSGISAKGLEITAEGAVLPLGWEQVSDSIFMDLLKKTDTSASKLGIAYFLLREGRTDEARDVFKVARAAHPVLVKAWPLVFALQPEADPVVTVTAKPGTDPVPTAMFSKGETITAIHVEDRSGTTRRNWPVSGGLPLPKGLVRDARQIGIKGRPCQTRVLSRWSDSSIRWVLLDFQADVKARGRSRYVVVKRKRPVGIPGNKLSTGGAITVDTGRVKFSVPKSGFGFISSAWVDRNGDGQYSSDEQIVKPGSGQDFFYDLQAKNPARPTKEYRARNLLKGTSRPVKNGKPKVPGGSQWMRPEGGGACRRVSARKGRCTAKVIEHGAMRTVVEIRGTCGTRPDSDEYIIRIHAFFGQPHLRVQHTFIFKGDPQKTNIRRMGLSLPLNLGGQPRFSAAGLSGRSLNDWEKAYLFTTGPDDVLHLEHEGFPLDWEAGVKGGSTTKGKRKSAGWINLAGENRGITAAFKDMASMYPKELSYDAKRRTLTAWIWPDEGGLVLDLRASKWPDGMQGISFTHDLFLRFDAKGAASPARAAAAFDAPLMPYADPEWYSYKGTAAGGMILGHDDRQFPNTEAELGVKTAFLERSMTEFGWLGMLNYGDMFWAYKYNEQGQPGKLGTWGLADRPDDYGAWRRGNTMISYRMFMQYMRTGEYRYWQAADAHLKHVRDVLIKHYSKDSPDWVGMGRRHSAYWGVGPGYDRAGGLAMDGYGGNWMGHWIHWNLSGDWRTYDVIGEQRAAWNRLGNSVLNPFSGGAYVGLKLTSGIPGYEAAGKEAAKFLKTAIERTSHPHDYWRDCTWWFGYSAYLADVKDKQIMQAVLDFWKVRKVDGGGYTYWQRDSTPLVYWAAEGHPDIRKAVYEELVKYGLEGKSKSRWVSLYKQYGIKGLFSCTMTALANSAAPGYWRAKDDIQQLQWDEPLVMAVIDHWRRNRK